MSVVTRARWLIPLQAGPAAVPVASVAVALVVAAPCSVGAHRTVRRGGRHPDRTTSGAQLDAEEEGAEGPEACGGAADGEHLPAHRPPVGGGAQAGEGDEDELDHDGGLVLRRGVG